jgi:hypothetical protein
MEEVLELDATTEKLIHSDPNAFKEAKEYLLDHFGSTYTITPEEGYQAMGSTQLFEKFMKAQDEFYHRFWCEEIAPVMTVDQFKTFTTTMNGDLGATFFRGLSDYLQKHFQEKRNLLKL